MHFYITGDTHGDFSRIEQFCLENDTTVEDVMIILGDAGINYYLDVRDRELKNELSQLDITLFCIHGNHEARPWEAADYDEKEWNGGIVYVEEQYPNILFAKDGEIYNFKDAKEIDIVLEHDGVLNPIEIKKTSNPSTELVKVFSLLDKSSTPRAKGAVICMKPGLSAIDRENYIVPIWMI